MEASALLALGLVEGVEGQAGEIPGGRKEKSVEGCGVEQLGREELRVDGPDPDGPVLEAREQKRLL